MVLFLSGHVRSYPESLNVVYSSAVAEGWSTIHINTLYIQWSTSWCRPLLMGLCVSTVAMKSAGIILVPVKSPEQVTSIDYYHIRHLDVSAGRRHVVRWCPVHPILLVQLSSQHEHPTSLQISHWTPCLPVVVVRTKWHWSLPHINNNYWPLPHVQIINGGNPLPTNLLKISCKPMKVLERRNIQINHLIG